MSSNQKIFFFLFISLFSIQFLFIFVSSECSRIYIAPMLKNRSTCSKAGNNKGDCFLALNYFVGSCYTNAMNIRELLTGFDFTINKTFTCLVKNGFDCSNRYVGIGRDMYIKENSHYGIKKYFKQEVIKDQSCLQNSMAIFFTDISCDEIYKYPDFNEMFNDGIEDTNDFLKLYGLKAFVIWLNVNNDITINRPCYPMMNKNFSLTSYIETKFMDSNKTEDGSLCAVTLPVFEPDNGDNKPNTSLAVGVTTACAVTFALILMFLFFWATRIKRRWDESKIEEFDYQHRLTTREWLFGPKNDEWEIKPRELRVDQDIVLGSGFSSKVYKGFLKKKRNEELLEMNVAVKFAHYYTNEEMRQDMIKEIGFMKKIGRHKHLLTMVGYVKSIDHPVIATEYCENGDLLCVLKQHDLHFMSKDPCKDVKFCLLLNDLIRLILEVCNGLVYLTSLKYVHRDIAARNILLTSDLTAKIGDFGLCRLANADLYVKRGGKLPIKHMPYEALKFGLFSEKSDIWSFAVFVYEMFSGGERPFFEVDPCDFIRHLEMNGKPQFPEETPKELVELLDLKCFQKIPDDRTTFVELEKDLTKFNYSLKNKMAIKNVASTLEMLMIKPM